MSPIHAFLVKDLSQPGLGVAISTAPILLRTARSDPSPRPSQTRSSTLPCAHARGPFSPDPVKGALSSGASEYLDLED